MSPDTRADTISIYAYSPLYGFAIGYVSNPATGSLVARYSNGMTRELALPCCAHCDAVLVEGYCAGCDELHPVTLAVDEPIPAELYTAADPDMWLDAMRAKYGDDFEQEVM